MAKHELFTVRECPFMARPVIMSTWVAIVNNRHTLGDQVVKFRVRLPEDDASPIGSVTLANMRQVGYDKRRTFPATPVAIG
jgi:hypothetical protein